MLNKKVLGFQEYLLEQQLSESIFGSERVVLFPGRFMPIHNAHIESMKKASEAFGLPVVPIQVISKNEKSPFSEKLLSKLGAAIVNEFDWIAEFVIYPQTLKTVIPQMVKYVREKYNLEPIGMGCGSDRLASYAPQVKYINSERSDVPVSEPFRIELCNVRTSDEISGTRVRAAIESGDIEAFKKMTPKSIHKFYDELHKELSKA